jgi:hypothetical protein
MYLIDQRNLLLIDISSGVAMAGKIMHWGVQFWSGGKGFEGSWGVEVGPPAKRYSIQKTETYKMRFLNKMKSVRLEL